ncbi:MAG TPA: hypothetical protein VLJ17_04315 [Xanthobacteraceae bacterium]|jgi:hypothetical protein|nr:hypothetical protein [Xanthobacteraceae bacterium]
MNDHDGFLGYVLGSTLVLVAMLLIIGDIGRHGGANRSDTTITGTTGR